MLCNAPRRRLSVKVLAESCFRVLKGMAAVLIEIGIHQAGTAAQDIVFKILNFVKISCPMHGTMTVPRRPLRVMVRAGFRRDR